MSQDKIRCVEAVHREFDKALACIPPDLNPELQPRDLRNDTALQNTVRYMASLS